MGSLKRCKQGITVDGVAYPGSTVSECRNEAWPGRGCFAYGAQLYYSTCDRRPLTRPNHIGFCQMPLSTYCANVTAARSKLEEAFSKLGQVREETSREEKKVYGKCPAVMTLSSVPAITTNTMASSVQLVVTAVVSASLGALAYRAMVQYDDKTALREPLMTA